MANLRHGCCLGDRLWRIGGIGDLDGFLTRRFRARGGCFAARGFATARTAPAAATAAVVPARAFTVTAGGRFGRQAFDLDARDLSADQVLDSAQQLRVVGRCQREGAAAFTGAAGTADAVDIVFRIERHVEIEDMGQAPDVQSARGHVAGDQQRDLTVAEALQRLFAY